VEVELRLAAALIDGGELEEARDVLTAIERSDPWEWRAAWYRGVVELAVGDATAARRSFAAVYAAVPGELAPKLALGLACETAGDAVEAAQWYRVVARTDPSITSASFGLARCRAALGDRQGAISAYERVPDSSSGHIDAQTARIGLLTTANGGGDPELDDLIVASSILEGLPLDANRRDRLTADLLEPALRLALAGRSPDNGHVTLAGCPFVERDLRLALERRYRALARHAGSRAEQIALIDQANRSRPRTWT
jgi:serine/threonine-protein kinase PknG